MYLHFSIRDGLQEFRVFHRIRGNKTRYLFHSASASDVKKAGFERLQAPCLGPCDCCSCCRTASWCLRITSITGKGTPASFRVPLVAESKYFSVLYPAPNSFDATETTSDVSNPIDKRKLGTVHSLGEDIVKQVLLLVESDAFIRFLFCSCCCCCYRGRWRR